MNIANKLVFAALLLVVLNSKSLAKTPADLEHHTNPFSWVGDVWIDERGAKCSEHAENYTFITCVREEYYEVYGNNLIEAHQSMKSDTPLGEASGRADTRVGWSINENGSCSMIVDTTITLPQLSAENDLSAYSYQRWLDVFNTLKKHEYDHHSISLVHFWKEFLNGCPDVNTATERVQKIQNEWDEETDHGRVIKNLIMILTGASLTSPPQDKRSFSGFH